MLWGGRREMATSSLYLIDGVPAMPQPNDLSRSLVALDQNSTIIAVIELSQSSWLVAGMLPGIERQPRKKLEPSPERLLGLLHRWRDEAVRAGRRSRGLRLSSKPAATASPTCLPSLMTCCALRLESDKSKPARRIYGSLKRSSRFAADSALE